MIVNGNRLIADEGKKLAFGYSIAVEVWLSPSDSVDNWKEITAEEAEALQKEAEEKARQGVEA